MSKVCQLSGKKPSMGHNVSHSNRKTKRRFNPNLITKRIVDPVTGKKLKVTMSVRAQKTLLKNPAKYTVALTKIRRKQLKRVNKTKPKVSGKK